MRLPTLKVLLEAPQYTDKYKIPPPPGIEPWERTYLPFSAVERQKAIDDFEKVIEHYKEVLDERGIHVTKLQKLGGGAMGMAYDIGGEKVLKITTDPDEARAAHHLKGKKNKNVYEVYDVIEFDGLRIFGIHQKKYPKKLMEDSELYDFYSKAYDHIFKPWINKQIDEVDMKSRLKDFIYPREHIWDKDRVLAFSQGIINGIHEMEQSRVTHTDSHQGNIMLDQAGNPVLIDPGVSKSPEAPITNL
jgi:hypothetical protein